MKMEIELKANCSHCSIKALPYPLIIEHLRKVHKNVFQYIPSVSRDEPEVPTLPYKDYITKLWAEFVSMDEGDC